MRPLRIGAERDAVMGLVVAVLCRGARYRAFPNSKRGFSAFSSTTGRGLKRDTKGGERSAGGDGGIRTLDRALQPYNGLANRRLQPLGHISRRNARATYARGIPPLQARGDRGSGYRDPHPHIQGGPAQSRRRGGPWSRSDGGGRRALLLCTVMPTTDRGPKYARPFQTRSTNRLIRRGRTAGNRA